MMEVPVMQDNNLRDNFMNPPEGYGMVPFWFWNDDLDEEHLLFQMKEMKEKGIEEFIIHARLGIRVVYLSDVWFEKVRFTLEKAEALGMKVWIYDEENWPSGYAGGRVLADNPEFCAKYLSMEKLRTDQGDIYIPQKNKHQLECLLVRKADGRLINLTGSITDGKVKNENYRDAYVFHMGDTLWNPAYSKERYVDLLSRKSAASFMKHTHEEYRRRLGKYFGNVVKGFFVDEPGFYNNFLLYEDRDDRHTIPWTEEFASYFHQRNGYAVEQILPYLWEGGCAQAPRARADYYAALAGMYKENFLEPIKKFCEAYGMQSIGHVHTEEFISYQLRTQGDMIEVLGSLSFSGIDRIDTNYEKVAEKYGSSASHIFGQERTLSETYANTGWSITLEQMKEIANWQYVRGINLLVPHAFYSSIEGKRKWDSPPSEFYQALFWPYFKQFSEYIKRLSYLLSQGRHVCPMAVYFPVRSCQALLTPYSTTEVDHYDRFFIDMSNALLEAQCDFDYITDSVIEKAHVREGSLMVQKEEYRAILFPCASYVPFAVVSKLEKFAENGGIVIVLGNAEIQCLEPEYDQACKDRWNRLLQMENTYIISSYRMNKNYTYKFDGDKVSCILSQKGMKDFRLRNRDTGIKYMHRKVEEKDVYFIVNEASNRKNIAFEVNMAGKIEKWDAFSGKITDYHARSVNGNSMIIHTDMEPYGSAVFVIRPGTAAICKHSEDIRYQGDGKWQVNANGTYSIEVDGVSSTAEVFDIPAELHLGGLWEVEVQGDKLQRSLGSWTDWGYEHYSGQAQYRQTFYLDPIPGIDYILNLGSVCNCAEVKVNGALAGYGLWAPFTFDITSVLVQGCNTIEVKVVNTLSNELESNPLASGLLGPVCIRGCKFIREI